ncbi:hypothetical protein SAMN04488128_1011764 [Chitinophaga eiseniae]|uniref:site-specific DNA-methyltransferase (cytosine-N(4)-specific) n=1 Tax=Chitinophaga eiseniae TaxID=634771 RepID=A0A1T4NUN7_9BACT|nr:site-specific DNA-methyltransferase [Chitinophaga eiseniae]SJZ82964.1 hypothetical protein SAMN04488128_1011764 [Chitinophaga eiseniae]
MLKSFSNDPKHALNAICPYYTMFPLEYPMAIMRKYKNSSPKLLDPFCGRGTSLYAARASGFDAWGIDSSPIAVSIAQAKLATTTLEAVMDLAKQLVLKDPLDIPSTPFFKHAYSKSTLKQISALREGLMELEVETDASVVLRAASLGCLHGPLNKTIGTAGYFSNQMPRTFASKPDYSVKYWKDRKLVPPKVDILKVIERKLNRILDNDYPPCGNIKQVVAGNSCNTETFSALPKDFDLIVTSPPYYGMKTYIQDQWLRMWFLGGDPEIDYKNEKDQIKHSGKDIFIQELASVWQNVKKVSLEDLHIYVRFGSVPSVKSDPKQIFRSSIEAAGGLKIVSTRNALDAHAGKRQANQMGASSKAAVEYDFHVVRC